MLGEEPSRLCNMPVLQTEETSHAAEEPFLHEVEIAITPQEVRRMAVMDRFCRTLGLEAHRSDVQGNSLRYRFATREEADVFRRQFGKLTN